ncbi:MAG: hypothetical protein AAFZ74_04395 [Pseudomonadota bacterium]
MDKTLLFWMVVGAVGFAFALAVQMRIVTALVLRRALGAWRAELTDRVKANTAVVWAAATRPMPDEAKPWLTDAVDTCARRIQTRSGICEPPGATASSCRLSFSAFWFWGARYWE